ncbi:MAG: type II toxin-antitoxin system RelE/ParE family toxin [Bacteroidales bacterium]|nr:type II toxin-antitoxin system RelE/ParE family toxin [Bacteroidales bacterium]MBS3775734.1 type II toxin-antitoxin system RelE/ParE family toxin [Bacteroidales bacterium]
MNFNVLYTSNFKKAYKRLIKKYASLKFELESLINNLEENPKLGTPLGKDCYKIRLPIKSKKKGKAGGARVITCVKITRSEVYLLTIYDKSEKGDITRKEFEELLKSLDK